jgi:hypothetical protein
MVNIERKVGPGLRFLLRFRVPESELERTYGRIIDAVSACAPDAESDLELAQRTRAIMNEIAPRPLQPIPRGSATCAPREIRAVLSQYSERDREIVNRRYAESQTIEDIAVGLHVREDEVRELLRGVKQRILSRK